MELEGKQVKICWNLKVNVLEQSDTLFKKFKNFDEMLIKTPSPTTDDHIKLLIKPTKVLIRSLDIKFSSVGSFYDINNMHIDHAEEIVKEQQESKSIVDGVPAATESIVTIINTVVKDSSSAVEIAAVKPSEVVKEQEIINTLDNVTKSKVAESVSRDSDTAKIISSSDIVALKDLLSDSEKRLRDRKMKITSLKISLASMEKKNAEKKLSVQKRDRKIKELEETMKIKDDAYKRFKEMHRSHKKENLRNCQDSLEMKLLELEVELSKKNVSISKLEEEIRSLRKFKSWSRNLEKELAALKKKLHSPLDDKEERSAEEVPKASSNIFGDEIEIEELPDTGNMATDSTDETIESISSFLAELGDTTNESIDPEVTSPKSKTKAASKSASVSHDPRKSSDDKVVLKQKAVSVDATRSNQMPASENDVVLINEESFNDTITTLSSDDEINLTRDGEENNLLESMLEDHPTFSKEEVITIQEEALKSFLTLKPFASLCAKSDNIVVNKKRIRQGKEGRDFVKIPSKRTKLDEFLVRALDL